MVSLFTTNIPNPEDDALTAHLVTSINGNGLPLTAAYLDLFNGDPEGTGYSVLATITGSATRTDVVDDLTASHGDLLNTETFTLISAAAGSANFSFAAIYDAPTGGTLLATGRLYVRGPFVTAGNPVVFDALDLFIIDATSGNPQGLLWGAETLTWGTEDLEWGA